jgi:hypothetical protein
MMYCIGLGYDLEHARQEAHRLKAWTSHYERKGCTKGKALTVARKKWYSSNTWPPQ